MKKARILLILIVIIALSNCKKSEPEVGQIGTLSCPASQLSGSVLAGVALSGATLTVPYTGGNGGKYEAVLANSSSVTGLTALLDAGSFADGNGNVTYTLTGTPSGSGNAIFTLSLGGQSCFVSILVTKPAGAVTGINCAGFQLSGALNSGVTISGASFSVPYSGGNGGAYDAQIINSTGVTGITATLASGSVNNGAGNLTYQLSGTPSGTGTANFNIILSGQSCSVSIPVTQSVGSVSSINCNGFQLSGTLEAWIIVTGAGLSLPYLGGNGGTYDAQTISSVGVTGLTATLQSGSFANGNGNVTYQLSGKASGVGNAIFLINLGGQTCNVLINVSSPAGCGAFVAPGQWKAFMCHNLGSANTSADPFTPSWEINGGYWQWGRATQAASGPTGPGVSQANSGAISDWDITPASNFSWLNFSKTSNDPCPTGYRVPTKAQWDGVLANNTQSVVGTWIIEANNYSSGRFLGSKLFLAAAGYRNGFINGELDTRGYYSNYWSSTKYDDPSDEYAWSLFFSNSNANTSFTDFRTFGYSVRCITE